MAKQGRPRTRKYCGPHKKHFKVDRLCDKEKCQWWHREEIDDGVYATEGKCVLEGD